METKMTSSYMTDVAVLCITLACPIPSSLSHMLKKPLRLPTVRRSAETALSRVLKMKTSVKMCPQLLRVKQRSPRRHITTTSTITNTGTGFLGAGRSFQRISSLEQRMLKHLSLLQAYITTISTRASTGRVT